jgi:putative spermidine/putrescine transport system substrate-binding protein
MKMNKKAAGFMCALLSLTVFAGCSTPNSTAGTTGTAAPGTAAPATPAPAGKEFAGKTLTVGSYGGVFDEAVNQYVVEKFQTETGAKVVLDPSYSYVKLAADNKAPNVDLVFLDDARVIQGGEAGLLTKLEPAKISEWANVYPQFIDSNNYGIAWAIGSYGIVYNKDKITTPPTSWNDLWKPEYKGKVAVNDIPSANATSQLLVAMARANGGDEKNIDSAFDKFKQLAPNLLAIANSTAQMTDLLTRDEVWIAPWWDGRALALGAKKANIGFVRPSEGAYATIIEATIPTNAKNQDMSNKFINMLLTTEAQTGFAKVMFYGPTNKNTKLPAEYADKVVYGEAVVSKIKNVDWKYIATVRNDWVNKWNQVIVPAMK